MTGSTSVQTALATAERQLPRLTDAPPRSIGARELLDESEQLLLSGTEAALRAAPSPGSTARMRLVLEALAAYLRLLRDHDEHDDPLTVFRRWPACTVVALAGSRAAPRTGPQSRRRSRGS